SANRGGVFVTSIDEPPPELPCLLSEKLTALPAELSPVFSKTVSVEAALPSDRAKKSSWTRSASPSRFTSCTLNGGSDDGDDTSEAVGMDVVCFTQWSVLLRKVVTLKKNGSWVPSGLLSLND